MEKIWNCPNNFDIFNQELFTINAKTMTLFSDSLYLLRNRHVAQGEPGGAAFLRSKDYKKLEYPPPPLLWDQVKN